MPSIRPSRSPCGHRLQTYLGFALIGLANAVLPFIVFSANYLIIPYPRWVVILIETLPGLAVKALLPHVLHLVPYWMRPLSVGSCWILAAFVTHVTPPNVPPPARIFTSMLASACTAATDVSMLGMLRYYGKTGLAGWGAGTGAGALVCAVLPFLVTVWMQSFLRTAIEFVYCLVGLLLVGYFAVLPRAPMNYPGMRLGCDKERLEDDPEDVSLLTKEPEQQRPDRSHLFRDVAPFMIPLAVSATAQSVVFPGIAHALPESSVFDSFFEFSTCYGLVFQLGAFVARTFIPVFRVRSTRVLFSILGVATSILLVDAILGLFSSYVLLGMLVLCAGLTGGAIYIIVVGKLMDEKATEPGVKQEVSLQMVGTGETAGVALGGLLGTLFEAQICRVVGGKERWCNTPL